MSKHLVLLDGHHLMYRAYWAIPRTLKTKAGEQTNTVFGVASMLLTILKTEEPDAILIAFDAGEETFRHQENATYKEGRAETPDDFYIQIPRVIQLVDAFGIHHVSNTKYEADDLLCTYAKVGDEAGMRITIVSGDRDLLQLANDNVTIAIPHKGYQQTEYLHAKEVEAKYGIRPDQVASYKGLCGDSSDNLPGVTGIGPKTAAELLQKYQNLDGIYLHVEEIRPAVREKLERDKDQAYFCEHMAQLICDVPLSASLDDLALNNMPVQPALDLFQELEFTLLGKRFRALLETDYGKKNFMRPNQETVVQNTGKRDEGQLTMF